MGSIEVGRIRVIDGNLEVPVGGDIDQILAKNSIADRDLKWTNPCLLTQVDALPTADVSLRGQMYLLKGGTGVADTVYVCIKDATETYVWLQL